MVPRGMSLCFHVAHFVFLFVNRAASEKKQQSDNGRVAAGWKLGGRPEGSIGGRLRLLVLCSCQLVGQFRFVPEVRGDAMG